MLSILDQVTIDGSGLATSSFNPYYEKVEEYMGLSESSAKGHFDRMKSYLAEPLNIYVNTIYTEHGGGLIMHGGGSVMRAHAGVLAANEVPAVLQRGEYVIQKSAVDKYGVGLMQAINSGMLGNTFGGDIHIHVSTPQTGEQFADDFFNRVAQKAVMYKQVHG
jgi:hypothetical protein